MIKNEKTLVLQANRYAARFTVYLREYVGQPDITEIEVMQGSKALIYEGTIQKPLNLITQDFLEKIIAGLA